MKKKRCTFPVEVSEGSVTIKIYRVRNKVYRFTTQRGKVSLKPRFSFMVNFAAGGQRHQRMFADFDEALAHAKSEARKLSDGELDALRLRAADARAYVNCVNMAKVTGLPLEVLVKDYVKAWSALGGRASVPEAAREYAHRHQHNMPKKTVPEAVEEMIKVREKDGTSDAYLKVLKVYLGQFKEKVQCQLTLVTTGMLTQYFRSLEVSPRSKNNARATLGAFFKFCKENGWVARDHEGVSQVAKFKERASEVIEVYSPKELMEILVAARKEMISFLTIGAFAGLRTAEIERLDWGEVHLKERFIEIKAAKAKTASRRLVPIAENLAAWLEPRRQEHGRVWDFENSAKQIGWLMEDVTEARAIVAIRKAVERLGRGDSTPHRDTSSGLRPPSPQSGEGNLPRRGGEGEHKHKRWTQEELVAAHRARRKMERAAFAERREKAIQEGHKPPEQPVEQITELPDGTEVKYQRAEWKKNALRHSFISYRVAETQDVAKVALEAGNSPQIIFEHYRELVRPKEAAAWCGITPAMIAVAKTEAGARRPQADVAKIVSFPGKTVEAA